MWSVSDRIIILRWQGGGRDVMQVCMYDRKSPKLEGKTWAQGWEVLGSPPSVWNTDLYHQLTLLVSYAVLTYMYMYICSSRYHNVILVPRPSRVFQRYTRKIGKAWSNLWCNDDILDVVYNLHLLAHATDLLSFCTSTYLCRRRTRSTL